MGDKTYIRFQVVTVARIEDQDEKLLKIDGENFVKYLDEDQKVSTKNDNQAGKYLLVEAKGAEGLVYITGSIQLLQGDGSTYEGNADNKDTFKKELFFRQISLGNPNR